MENVKVYAIITSDNKMYVGQTIKETEARIQEHFRESRYHSDHNSRLYNWMRKYITKYEEIQWKVLQENCEWNTDEVKWISKMKSEGVELLNLTDGGDGSLGFKHSEESRKQMSKSRTGPGNARWGKSASQETRKKISEKLKGRFTGSDNAFFGKTHTEETRNKISEAHLGKSLSEEHRKKLGDAQRGEKNYWFGKSIPEEVREKMSISRKGRFIGKDNPNFGKKMTDENKEKLSNKHSIPVRCINNNTIYKSATEAGKQLGLSRSEVSAVANGNRKHTKGFIFTKIVDVEQSLAKVVL